LPAVNVLIRLILLPPLCVGGFGPLRRQRVNKLRSSCFSNSIIVPISVLGTVFLVPGNRKMVCECESFGEFFFPLSGITLSAHTHSRN